MHFWSVPGLSASIAVDLSVIMTTYERREVLRRTLLLYNGQLEMAGRFEIVLVDDGSTDGTLDMVEALRPELTYPLKCLALPANEGPAKARNLGIDHASGLVVFITGDDILPRPDLLHQHWMWHVRRFPQPHVGVLGRVVWAPELEQTALMRWLEVSGDQFAYGDCRDGDAVPYSRLYTCNVSFKRRFLTATGERLNEQIQILLEDSEWGLRLARKGMELRYNAAAMGDHLHPTTLASSLRRQHAIGARADLLEAINPEEFHRVTAGLFRPRGRRKLALAKILLHPLLARFVYVPLARFFERRAVVDRVFAAAHASAMMAGLREATSRRRDQPLRPGGRNAVPAGANHPVD